MADLYRVLGVERDADPDRIKKAYKRLVRQYHPDVTNHQVLQTDFKRSKRHMRFSLIRRQKDV